MPTNIDQLQIEVETKSEGAIQGLKGLKEALVAIENASKSNGLDTMLTKLEKISKLNFDNLKALKNVGNISGGNTKSDSGSTPTTPITVVPDTGGIDDAVDDIGRVTDAVDDIPKAPKVDVETNGATEGEQKVSRFSQILAKLKGTGAKAASGLKKVSSALKSVSQNFKKSSKHGMSLTRVFKHVLMYGSAYRLFSALTRAISEGLKNLANYSEETMANMSKLSTMGLQLKNTVGAALYPAIVALTPALQKLADVVMTVFNTFGKLVAVMSGKKTYLQAKEYFKKYGEDAKTAAKKAKNAFAGMDDITVIGEKNTDTNDGDPSQMFEEVEIDTDKYKKLLGVITAIGTAIAAWKLGSFITSLVTSTVKVNTLKEAIMLLGKKLTLTVGVTLAITGIVLETKGIISAIKEGLNKINFMEIVGGGGMIIAGGALIGAFFGNSIIGAAIGAIVAGVPMFITGIYDAIKNGLNWLNGMLIPLGATLTGAGIGAIIGMIGGPIGAGIGALIGLIVGLLTDLTILIIQNWDSIAAFFVNIWSGIVDFFAGVANWVNETILQPIIQFFTPFFEAIAAVFGAIWSVVSSVFETIWYYISTVFNAIYEVIAHVVGIIIDIFVGMGKAIWAVITKIYEIVSTVFEMIWAVVSWLFGLIWDALSTAATWVWNTVLKPIVDFVGKLVTKVVEAFTSIVNKIKTKVIDPIINFFKKMIDTVVGFFKNIGIKVADAISGVFKSVMNGVFTIVENCVNFFIKGLNGAINIINKIPGVNIKKIELLEIPRFQTGGFPEDGLFMANHGELVGKFSNGKTAVANNDQIVDGIASGVYAANSEQNGLLREQNKLLRQLVENGSNGQIDVTTITSAMQRKNRRDGRTVVPVGI